MYIVCVCIYIYIYIYTQYTHACVYHLCSVNSREISSLEHARARGSTARVVAYLDQQMPLSSSESRGAWPHFFHIEMPKTDRTLPKRD